MLTTLLRSVRTAADLAPVFGALGYAPDVQHLDDGTILLARWRAFEVLCRESLRPRDEARSLAASLATRSRRALATAIGSGELAIAAPRLGAGGSTRVLVLSLSAPDRPALDLLQRLAPSGSPHALYHALRVRELLSTEGVGDRFYRSFRELFRRMTEALGARGTPGDRQTAALLALTRVLFLYFVQAKGWLDGRPDYLRSLLDTALCRRRHFHRAALHPLFFGTLNRKPEERRVTVRLGRIPYLNGGLFQPHPAERRLGNALFDNDLWRDAFDGVFEKFRFTVHESQDAGAIAPDMLGRVFERLMDPADRRTSGTFYTPEPVVRQVVAAAIDLVLENAAEPGRLEAVRQLKLLDPAVGSGAFLLGALERLAQLRAALGERGSLSAVRRRVLRDNLFGVDLSPVAVRLAELRLWLAVIADDPAAHAGQVAPLPNLDGVVRQGDTLLDPLGAARVLHHAVPRGAAAAVNAVHAARRALYHARGEEHRASVRDLRRAESELARGLVGGAVGAVNHQLHELEVEEQSLDLFGLPRGLTPDQVALRRRLLRRRAELHEANGHLADGRLPFFSFEVHAADIMAAGGFHAVIGNPPWVRAERLSPPRRRVLRERFSWWTAGGLRGFSHQPDLAVAFLQRALELAAPGGTVALLVPSKLLTARYAETARRSLVRETRLACLHRVADTEAARFGATTYPTALVIQKRPPAGTDRVRLSFQGGDTVSQSALGEGGFWILAPDHERDALAQLRASGRPLAEIAPPALGVKTGADHLFVGDVVERGRTVSRVRLAGREVAVETSLVRPAIRGRDIRPFRVLPACVVLWTHGARGEPLASLPPLAQAHFERHRSELQRRADYTGGPVWALFRTRAAISPHAVVWRDIARKPAAVVLQAARTGAPVPLNTCYVAAPARRNIALAVCALFNSTWGAALLRSTADEAQGGYRRINARVAGTLPVPADDTALATLAAVAESAATPRSVSQDDLDDAVASVLELSSAARDALRRLAARR